MRACLITLAVWLLPLIAQAQTNDLSNPIVARTAALVEAFNAQDLAAVAAIYAQDAILLAPGKASVRGREAIAAEYATAFRNGAHDMQFMTFDIRGFDNTAIEIGETITMVGENRIIGRYMHVWEAIDGEILLIRDMFHVLRVE
ncbi:MAG: DUF4440 domain-containing protein [Pseudomonadota bacterium]